MAQKILLAVDGSQRGFEAVSIVGGLVREHPDFHLVLFHCVQELSALLPGELCAGLEASCVLTKADQERCGEVIFEECRRRLLAIGFPESRIAFKMKALSTDPAQDILAEADSEKIRTIAVGRRGVSQVRNLLLGSVSSKVAHYATSHAVWIVDTPVHDSRKVLVPMEGIPDGHALSAYLGGVYRTHPRPGVSPFFT